ncbi:MULTISPECIES: hypothetical protein [Paraburkholderia]|uniref:hypothetical protein n=1 Tax=Paraburkholderia TaxID=1822464 RepID=UPI0012E0B0CC|nr:MULTISPECIES: hypothetical protein [Paraburkholderia]
MAGRKKWNEVDTGRIHKEHDARMALPAASRIKDFAIGGSRLCGRKPVIGADAHDWSATCVRGYALIVASALQSTETLNGYV